MQSRSSAPASSGPITELQLLPPVLRVELERYSYLLSVGPSQHTRTHLLFRPLPVCLCRPTKRLHMIHVQCASTLLLAPSRTLASAAARSLRRSVPTTRSFTLRHWRHFQVRRNICDVWCELAREIVDRRVGTGALGYKESLPKLEVLEMRLQLRSVHMRHQNVITRHKVQTGRGVRGCTSTARRICLLRKSVQQERRPLFERSI